MHSTQSVWQGMQCRVCWYAACDQVCPLMDTVGVWDRVLARVPSKAVSAHPLIIVLEMVTVYDVTQNKRS